MLPTSLSTHCNKIESYVLSPPASEDSSAALTRWVQLALIDCTPEGTKSVIITD